VLAAISNIYCHLLVIGAGTLQSLTVLEENNLPVIENRIVQLVNYGE
jgi:hypothetical protein